MKSNIKEEYYKPLIEIVELSNNAVIATSTDPGTVDIPEQGHGG